VGSDTARGRRGEGRRGRVSGIKQRETSTEPSKEWFKLGDGFHTLDALSQVNYLENQAMKIWEI
jgi:hypothetical protein